VLWAVLTDLGRGIKALKIRLEGGELVVISYPEAKEVELQELSEPVSRTRDLEVICFS